MAGTVTRITSWQAKDRSTPPACDLYRNYKAAAVIVSGGPIRVRTWTGRQTMMLPGVMIWAKDELESKMSQRPSIKKEHWP
jgi:hypothetical protein